jgi:hypothetical protein
MTDVSSIWRFNLVPGLSEDPRQGACMMSALSWLHEGTLDDHPRCVCPVLAEFCRHANDTLDETDRQRLKLFIPRLAGSRDPRARAKRARIIVDTVARAFPESGSYPRQLQGHLSDWHGADRLIKGRHYEHSMTAAGILLAMLYGARSSRALVADTIFAAMNKALVAGKQGEIDPVVAAEAMDRFEEARAGGPGAIRLDALVLGV